MHEQDGYRGVGRANLLDVQCESVICLDYRLTVDRKSAEQRRTARIDSGPLTIDLAALMYDAGRRCSGGRRDHTSDDGRYLESHSDSPPT